MEPLELPIARMMNDRKKQRALAENVGVTQPTISMIENGVLKARPELKRKIANALSLRPEDIQWPDMEV
jgi:DNA-binding XRE family transcriptional regulator